MLGLLGKLAQLQLVEHAHFVSVAVSQRYYPVRQDAPRGEILDRNGKKLATVRTAYRVHMLYPAYVHGSGPNLEVLGRLAGLLALDPARLAEGAQLLIDRRRYYEPLLIKDDLSPQELTILLELRATIPGLFIDEHAVRHYPYGESAAHVLGHLGQVESSEQARTLGGSYLPGDIIGKMGLEQQYESVLRGAPGLFELEVDAALRPTGQTRHRLEVSPGQSIRTTLDLELQQMLEETLVRTLAHVRATPDYTGVRHAGANAGAAVVMDVKTGAILAMVSYPTFNPADITAGGGFYNRAVSGKYQPGSTWKMLTGAAALEHGLVGSHEHVYCGGVFDKIEPKLDWKLDGHGRVDLVSALANSCNIYFYEMGYRIGVERLASMAAEFGFGQPLGIDLPEEEAGWIPDSPSRKADTNPAPWNGGRLLAAAIGQELTATPLQLAQYTAVLANGGRRVQPHLATAVYGTNGQLLKELTPPQGAPVRLKPGTLTLLKDGMEAATDWGTSANAFKGLPVKVAGKTGTAEVSGPANCNGQGQCNYGVFVAYAPADNPEIAIAVVGERAGRGDAVSPAVRAVVAHYFGLSLSYHDPLYLNGIWTRPAGMTAPPRVTPPPAPDPAPPEPPPQPSPEPPPDPAPPGDPEPTPEIGRAHV